MLSSKPYGHNHLVETRIANKVDSTNHRGANIIVITSFKVTVKEDALAESIESLLMIVVRHGEIGL